MMGTISCDFPFLRNAFSKNHLNSAALRCDEIWKPGRETIKLSQRVVRGPTRVIWRELSKPQFLILPCGQNTGESRDCAVAPTFVKGFLMWQPRGVASPRNLSSIS